MSNKTLHRKSFLQRFIKRHPLLSFIFSLILVAILLVVSYFLRTTETALPLSPAPIRVVKVQDFDRQYLTVQGQVQKNGVVQVVAQTSGIVQKVNIKPGQNVKAKSKLVTLSSNYNGSNAPGLQAQQAALNYNNNLANIDSQKEIIALQRRQTDAQFDAAEHSFDVNRGTLATTRDNLIVTHDQLNYIQRNIEALEKSNSNGSNDDALSPLRTAKIQLLSTLSQLDSSVKNLEYQTKEDTFPTQSPTVQHEIALKQLDLQEKSLDLQLASSKLGLQLAQVQASLMSPVTPIAGVVQKVNVKAGDLVSPGQVIAVISSDDSSAYIDVPLAREVAQSLSLQNPVQVVVAGENHSLDPTFVSQVPVTGGAYNLRLDLSPEIASLTDHKSNVMVELPLLSATSSSRLVSIDAIYQTQLKDYLYVTAYDEAGSASAALREVELGKVIGSQVEVVSGLTNTDQVILDRQIKPGDPIQIQ